MTEPITVDDYKLVSDEFFQKYDFVDAFNWVLKQKMF